MQREDLEHRVLLDCRQQISKASMLSPRNNEISFYYDSSSRICGNQLLKSTFALGRFKLTYSTVSRGLSKKNRLKRLVGVLWAHCLGVQLKKETRAVKKFNKRDKFYFQICPSSLVIIRDWGKINSNDGLILGSNQSFFCYFTFQKYTTCFKSDLKLYCV